MKTISELRSDQQRIAMNVLRLASNVANGEQVVIGQDTFEIDIINTDSTQNTAANMNNTDKETDILFTAHGRKVGDLVRVENEIMSVAAVIDVNNVRLTRARAGTTIAAHTAPQDIFISDAAPALPIIPVGLVTTLTPTVASAALVNAINDKGTQGVEASAPTVNGVVIRTKHGAQARPIPCTETLAGANNAWASATMYSAGAGDLNTTMLLQRAANATEVALDQMVFDFPFTVGALLVQVRTSAGALKTWDGAATASGRRVTVGNGGAADWAAGDLITVLAAEA